jgi:hypothetical protein
LNLKDLGEMSMFASGDMQDTCVGTHGMGRSYEHHGGRPIVTNGLIAAPYLLAIILTLRMFAAPPEISYSHDKSNMPYSIFRIPILAMTAHAMQEHREKCLEAGMDDFIAKPSKRKELFSKIEQWAPRDLDQIYCPEVLGNKLRNQAG